MASSSDVITVSVTEDELHSAAFLLCCGAPTIEEIENNDLEYCIQYNRSLDVDSVLNIVLSTVNESLRQMTVAQPHTDSYLSRLEKYTIAVQRSWRAKRLRSRLSFVANRARFEQHIARTTNDSNQPVTTLLLQGQAKRAAAQYIAQWWKYHRGLRRWRSLKQIVSSIKFAYRLRRLLQHTAQIRKSAIVLQRYIRRIIANTQLRLRRLERRREIEAKLAVLQRFQEDPISNLLPIEQLLNFHTELSAKANGLITNSLRERRILAELVPGQRQYHLNVINDVKHLKAKVDALQSSLITKRAALLQLKSMPSSQIIASEHIKLEKPQEKPATPTTSVTKPSTTENADSMKKTVRWRAELVKSIHRYPPEGTENEPPVATI